MTYFTFLAIFLGIPIAVLSLITLRDFRRGDWLPSALSAWRAWVVLMAICVVALVYTTPWDNYLVATSVWWYDEALVNGLIIGYVPIEEYTFFLLQPVMIGLFLLLLMRRMPLNPIPADSMRIRVIATGMVFVIWAISVVWLVLSFVDDNWRPYTYLALELSWALIPVMIQMAFGADILWRHRRVVLTTILIGTAYLSFADALAIGSGTWTIDPAQSLQIYLGGILPVEELIFFLLTNILIVLGVTLVLAEESQERAAVLERFAFYRRLLAIARPNSAAPRQTLVGDAS